MDKITIIVPVYNAENTIERCLASFISNRDYIQEVILVNDRSTDRTFEKIDQFRQFFDIRVIDNEGNKGPGPGRKTGLLAATTEWITFVDTDDCLTPSSLYYVNKKIKEQPNLLLLHTQTTYYESGNFVKENVTHSDYSCGGNFYKRQFLVTHKLFPHKELFMAEDEYFNCIVTKFIQRYDNESSISWYDYPVYEVHHDFDTELSFSFQHWSDYLCKYHLMYTRYAVDFFAQDKELYEELKKDLFEGFIFAFYLFIGLKYDTSVKSDEANIFDCFYTFIKYCQEKFNISQEEFISYFNDNKPLVKSLYRSACVSVGNNFNKYAYSFPAFVKILYNHKE